MQTTQNGTTGTEMIKHTAAGALVASGELAERAGNVRQHYAAFVESALTGAEFAWKVGADLVQIKSKQLYRAAAGGLGFDEWVVGEFGFSASWAKLAMRLATDVPLPTIAQRKLSLPQWREIFSATSQIPQAKRLKVVDAAAARVDEERRAQPAAKPGPKPKADTKAKPAAKDDAKPANPRTPARAREVADEEVKKAGEKVKPKAEPAPTRRAPKAGEVQVRILTLGPAEVPETGKVPLLNPKTFQPWTKAPKSPKGSTFQILIGRQMLACTIHDDHVSIMVGKRPPVGK